MVFFLPGYSWLLISGLIRSMHWLEQATLAFVISVALLSLLTAGLSLFTVHYLLLSLIISLVGSIAILGLYVWKNRVRSIRRLSLKPLPKPLALCLLIYVFLLVAGFWATPYYPPTEAPDLLTHAQVTQAILVGGGRNALLHEGFPIGLHFVSALAAYVLQVGSLDAIRIVTSPVLLAIVSLFYFSARRMFGSDRTAGVVVVVGSLVLPVDLNHFVRLGTYPNLLGDCLVLCLLWFLISYVNQPSRALGLSMIPLTIAGVFFHSSFFLFLAAAFISAPFIFCIASKTTFRNYARGLLYLVAGFSLFAAILWPLFSENIGRIIGSYVEVGEPLIPSVLRISYFNFIYDLGYFFGWVNVAVLFAGILFSVFLGRKNLGSLLILIWLGIQFVGPTFSEQSYRFVLFGMLPASFIIGKELAEVRSWANPFSGLSKRFTALALPLLLLILILSGSLPGLIPRMINPNLRVRQEAIFDSMQWLGGGQSNCRVVASSGLWPDYLYVSVLTNIKYSGDFVKPPAVMLQKSIQLGFSCVAVADDSAYFSSFQTSRNFVVLYRNQLVWIFLITQ